MKHNCCSRYFKVITSSVLFTTMSHWTQFMTGKLPSDSNMQQSRVSNSQSSTWLLVKNQVQHRLSDAQSLPLCDDKLDENSPNLARDADHETRTKLEGFQQAVFWIFVTSLCQVSPALNSWSCHCSLYSIKWSHRPKSVTTIKTSPFNNH